MSLELYDNAFRSKLLDLYDNVVVAPPEQAFNRSNVKGKVKLPLISLYRLSNPIDFDDYNHYETFVGGRRRKEVDSEASLLVQGLPITITYQVDIWAQLRKYADSLYREVVFYLWRNPNITIKLPNVDISQDFSLTLTDTESGTDYDSFDEKNTIHRYTLTYEITRARLFFEKEGSKLVKDIPIDYIKY